MGASDAWILIASSFVGWSHILSTSQCLYSTRDITVTPQCRFWVGKRLHKTVRSMSGFGNQTTWIPLPGLSFTSCVPASCVPQFPYL